MSGTSYELPFDHGEPVPPPQAAPETDHALMGDLSEFNATEPDQDEELAVPIAPATRTPEAAPDPGPAPAMATPEADFERAGESLGVTPESMEALRADENEERFGVDSETLAGIIRGAGLDPELVDEGTLAQMERAGVGNAAEATQFWKYVAEAETDKIEKQAIRDGMAETRAMVEELKNTGPASPFDARLARIEAAVTERQERDAVLEQMERDDTRRTVLHGGALDQLARVAQHMGIEPPDGASVAEWFARNNAWDMDPNTAARLAFIDLGAGAVVGMKADRRSQRVVRPGATPQRLVDGEEEFSRGPFVIPGGASGQGQAYRPRVEDILADDDDDGSMRVWGGGR